MELGYAVVFMGGIGAYVLKAIADHSKLFSRTYIFDMTYSEWCEYLE